MVNAQMNRLYTAIESRRFGNAGNRLTSCRVGPCPYKSCKEGWAEKSSPNGDDGVHNS